MWHSLIGRSYPFAGSAPGTVTLPVGACLINLVVHATTGGTTVNVFGKFTLTIIGTDTAPSVFQFFHLLYQASAGANTIVFGANTNMYFIDSVMQGNV